MKKIPILLSSILVFSMVFAGILGKETHAMFKDDEEWPWWSVEELLEYRDEVLREEQELCGDNVECREELYFSKMENENEKDNKYQSLQMLIEQRFVVTSVNPTTGVVKVLYNNEDEWMRRMGIDEREDLNVLYVGWLEENPNQIYSLPLPLWRYMLDDVVGAHKIYSWQTGEGDYLLNPGVEVELPTVMSLDENSLGKIGYVAEANFYNAVGQFDYLSCLSEPDYRPGMDCKLMLSAGHALGYFPPRESLEEIEDSNNVNSIDNGNEDDTNNASKVTGISEQISDLKSDDVNSEVILTPETGEARTNNEKNIEMPWWMATIFIVGAGIITWFFWPSRKNKKNHKKSIDKPGRI